MVYVTLNQASKTALGGSSVLAGGGGGSSGGSIIPANRQTLWQPGVTYNTIPGASTSGIPNRTTIFTTLSPSGGADDPQIQTAVNNCPAGQVVLLAAGTFKITNRININTPNITLRGAGPGTGCSGGINAPGDNKGIASVLQGNGTGTFLVLQDRGGAGANTNLFNIGAINANGLNGPPPVPGIGQSINLAADAIQGSFTCTVSSNPGLSIGQIVLIDELTANDPDVFVGTYGINYPAGQDPGFFNRQARFVGELKEITAINGNVITFATPFGHTYPVANTAQLSTTNVPMIVGVGVEELAVMGGTVNGNFTMGPAAYCWVKHVESYYGLGAAIMSSCYRCEFRDSYFHETPNIAPGGGGYLTACTTYSSECLFENNIMWNGNKVITGQTMGTGNVLAYNYMDDPWGESYPDSPEAGVNCAHSAGSHMALVEGNWSHKFDADNYWGSQFDITALRNWFTALRGARLWLNGYMNASGTFQDYGGNTGRNAVDILSHSYRQNLVGNVLGMQGQTLLPARSGQNNGLDFGNAAQTGPVYETLSTFPGTNVTMYAMGGEQLAANPWTWVPDTYTTQLRQGNWDWFTQTQIWYATPIGATGTASTGIPQTIPNSLYLLGGGPPAFWGNNPWPWVNPATGATFTLPAKARFDAGVAGGSFNAVSTPDLIQMVSSSGLAPSYSGVTANNFNFTPPNAIGAGNCLVMLITLGSESQAPGTISVSDNVNGAWPAAAVSAYPGGTTSSTAIFVLPNAKAGITSITFSASSNLPLCVCHYDFLEWNNIVLSNPVNGTASTANVAAPSLTCGSFTPGNNNGNGGNLILAYFCIPNGGATAPSNWTPGGSFNLLEGDTWWGSSGVPKASMYEIQKVSGAVNPGITATGATNNYNCVAVALKIATVTGTPKPAGIHVNKLIQYFFGSPTSGSVLFPATGNLRVLTSTGGGLATVTDNEGGGTWAGFTTGNPWLAYSPNKSPNAGLKVTVAGAGGNACLKFWDIQGAAAAPYDVSATEVDSNGNVSVINNAPVITPTTSNGIVFAMHDLGVGPCLGFAAGAPANAIFINTNYTGKLDSDSFDSGDCDGFLYNPDTSTLHWNWTVFNNPFSGGNGLSVAFKKA